MSRLLRHFLFLFYRPDRLAVGLFLLYTTQVFGDTATLERLQQWAEQGDSQAQLALAKRYANGIELPRNTSLAVEWLTKAATQGDAEAQFYLGWMYAHGKGVEQNPTQAFHWLKLAAQQNDAQAQYLLAQFYEKGFGTLPSNTQAQIWYHKAYKHRFYLACQKSPFRPSHANPPSLPLHKD